MVDMHCHLDFVPCARVLADELCVAGSLLFSNTVSPRAHCAAAADLGSARNVRVGLGLHPWWVADGRCGEEDVAAFERLAPQTPFVGEVGLDFSAGCLRRSSGEGRDPRVLQTQAFERVVRACASSGSVRVVSLHAVAAEGAVLDVLDRCDAFSGSIAWVFHGFGGSQDALTRAMERGCCVSVGPRMMATKRGRAYAAAIPENRLFMETDLPSREGQPITANQHAGAYEAAFSAVMEARRVDTSDRAGFRARLERRSANLLGLQLQGDLPRFSGAAQDAGGAVACS